jgi:meiotically up-regulated gene 157 (Mug157) protein
MPTQRQIERFTLEFHQVEVDRLRGHPEHLTKAVQVLNRWESQGVSPFGQVYRDIWRRILGYGVDEIEKTVCVDTDKAATIRSMSPLGFLLSEDERMQIRRKAMAL